MTTRRGAARCGAVENIRVRFEDSGTLYAGACVRINGEVFCLPSLASPSVVHARSTSLAQSNGHSAISDDKVVGIISSGKKVLIRHHSLVPPMNFKANERRYSA